MLNPVPSFFFDNPATTEISTLSLHDALPISFFSTRGWSVTSTASAILAGILQQRATRSEEHTSELQSLRHLVCRLLLEKKKLIASAPLSSSCAERSANGAPGLCPRWSAQESR